MAEFYGTGPGDIELNEIVSTLLPCRQQFVIAGGGRSEQESSFQYGRTHLGVQL